MRKEKIKAFTEKWALFCAGKYDMDKDFILKSRILRDKDFRFGEYERANVRFSSMIHVNLSGSRIADGGKFIGNGWYGCSFSGARYNGITVEMDQYEQCAMGNAVFCHMKMLELKVRDCSFAGSLWENADLEGCIFEGCNFRKVSFRNCVVNKTLFLNCIFDDTEMGGAVWSDTVFRGCLVRGWRNAVEKGCIFENCTFENC